MGYSNDPVGDLLKSLGWLFAFAFALIGAISCAGWAVYGIYSLFMFLI